MVNTEINLLATDGGKKRKLALGIGTGVSGSNVWTEGWEILLFYSFFLASFVPCTKIGKKMSSQIAVLCGLTEYAIV